MCADKFSNHSTAKYNALVLHALIQAALAYVFVAQWNNWIIPVVIGVSHFIIDYVKSMFKRKDLISLVWDQLAHLCVIVGLWLFSFARSHQLDMAGEIFSTNFWLIATAYITVLAPTSILIKSFIEYEKWLPSDASSQGLPNAGKWIGYLEKDIDTDIHIYRQYRRHRLLIGSEVCFQIWRTEQSQGHKDYRVCAHWHIRQFHDCHTDWFWHQLAHRYVF